MFLIDSEREKELQRMTENLVAENITGCTQAASLHSGQMGCKSVCAVTSSEVIYSPRKAGLQSLATTPQSSCHPFANLAHRY